MMTNEIEREESLTSEAEKEILNFLDFAVLMLSQVNNAEDVDIIMDDFLSDEMYNVLNNNQALFSVLSIVWVNTFNRVFVEREEISFPIKLLRIPVLFDKFNWKIEDQAMLSSIHSKCLLKVIEENTLTNLFILLFIEGIFYSQEMALGNFKGNVKKIAKTDDDKMIVNELIENLETLGWPKSTSPLFDVQLCDA